MEEQKENFHENITCSEMAKQNVQGPFFVSSFSYDFRSMGPVSRKSRELFGPEKPFVKLRPAYSEKLVFSYVVKGIKIKITAKFRASRRLRFEDTKRIMSPEIRPKSFGTFEKQAPGLLGRRRPGNEVVSQSCIIVGPRHAKSPGRHDT